MAKWLDPIVYHFYFTAINDQPYEPEITKIFRSMIIPCKEWIKRALGIGEPYPVDPLFHGFNANSHKTFDTWTDNRTVSDAEFDRIWDEILLFLDDDYAYMMECEVNEKYCKQYWCQKKTSLGEEAHRFFGMNMKEGFNVPEFLKKNENKVCDLLNCPNETLEGITLLLSDLYGYSFFRICLLSQQLIPSIIYKEEDKEKACKAWNLDPTRTYYEHRISISLPRFFAGMGKEIDCLQQLWCDAMEKLGSRYELTNGSIFMDFPSAQIYNRFSCHTPMASFPILSEMANYVPGYAWGMMLNRKQCELIEKLEEYKKSNGFFKITEFANGNHYFQLTPDVRRMKKEEAIFLRRVFEPYLSEKRLVILHGCPPDSFRLGCTLENLSIDRYGSLSVLTPKEYLSSDSDGRIIS